MALWEHLPWVTRNENFLLTPLLNNIIGHIVTLKIVEKKQDFAVENTVC